MQMKQLPLEEASDDQIREFVEVQGIDVDARADRSSLLAALSSVWAQDYILAADLPEPGQGQFMAARVEPEQRLVGGIGKKDPKVIVTIGTTSNPGGQFPASVAVNGFALVIQRNMKVEIPYRYYLALANARTGIVEQPDIKQPPVEVEVTNYPLTFLQMPSVEEIRDFHTRTDDDLMPA